MENPGNSKFCNYKVTLGFDLVVKNPMKVVPERRLQGSCSLTQCKNLERPLSYISQFIHEYTWMWIDFILVFFIYDAYITIYWQSLRIMSPCRFPRTTVPLGTALLEHFGHSLLAKEILGGAFLLLAAFNLWRQCLVANGLVNGGIPWMEDLLNQWGDGLSP